MPLFSPLQRRETPSQPGKQLPSQDGQVGLAFPPAPHRRPPQLLGCRAFQDPGRTAHSCRGGLGPNGPCVQHPAGARDARPCLEPSPERSPRQKQWEALGKPCRAWLVAQRPGKSNDAEPESLSRGVCPPRVCGGGGSGAAERRQSEETAMPTGPGSGQPAWPGHTSRKCCAGCEALATASSPTLRAYSAPYALC